MKYITVLLFPLFLMADQYWCVRKAFEFGKQYDLGHTLAGIVWQESKCKYRMNVDSGDYGITHVNIHSLLRRLGKPNNHYTRSEYASHLVANDIFAMQTAVAELLYWKLDRNRVGWEHMVNSYNEGNNVEHGVYASKVRKAIQFLKAEGVIR